jgi:hypothetical protein
VVTDPGWLEVRRIEGANPRHAVCILHGPHGLFRYDEMRWRKYYEPSEADDGPMDGGWWDCAGQSGLHQSAEAAEDDARKSVAWLRNQSG